jgi:hypothetical protein
MQTGTHLILTAALIVSSHCVAKAQAAGQLAQRRTADGEGNIMLQGRIYFPSGQVASGRTIRVSLESAVRLAAEYSGSGSGWCFPFQWSVPGDYTVVVDAGPNLKSARTRRHLCGNEWQDRPGYHSTTAED